LGIKVSEALVGWILFWPVYKHPSETTIYGNNISNNGNGTHGGAIKLVGPTNLNVTNNRIDSNLGYAVQIGSEFFSSSANISVISNTFNNNYAGVIVSSSKEVNTIKDNYFENNTHASISFNPGILNNSATANVITTQ